MLVLVAEVGVMLRAALYIHPAPPSTTFFESRRSLLSLLGFDVMIPITFLRLSIQANRQPDLYYNSFYTYDFSKRG